MKNQGQISAARALFARLAEDKDLLDRMSPEDHRFALSFACAVRDALSWALDDQGYSAGLIDEGIGLMVKAFRQKDAGEGERGEGARGKG